MRVNRAAVGPELRLRAARPAAKVGGLTTPIQLVASTRTQRRSHYPARQLTKSAQQTITTDRVAMSDPSSSTSPAVEPVVAPAAAAPPPDPKAEAIKAYRAKIIEHETAEQSLKDSK